MAKAWGLVDTFDDNVINATLWTATSPVGPVAERVREVNGRLEIRPAGNPVGYARLESATTYDLTDSHTWVEVVRVLRQATGAATQFVAVGGPGNSAGFSQTGDHITIFQYLAGVFTGLHTVPYDPEAHRWWRLREFQGTTFWEASRDNDVWTVLYSEPTPFTVTAVTIRLEAAVSGAPVPAPGTAVFDNVGVVEETSRARRIEERRRSARDLRVEAAEVAAARRHDEHANNNDEVGYTTRPLAGSYSKSLKHDAFGDPDAASYASLLRALQSQDPQDFEEIQLASATAVKLTNPQAGLAFQLSGPDPQQPTLQPAPRFDSEVAAHEAGELYWMALARDVHFAGYGSDATIAAAVTSLNNEFPRYGGPAPVTAANIFRGVYAGELVGPYVSQFLLKGNTDTRKPDGLGRDANEGFVSHGAQVNDQRIIPATANVDYLTAFATWLDVQNGVDKRGQDSFETTRRFIRNLRDGATYVHFDQVINAFYNAAHLLTTEPTGNQLALQAGITGRPQVDLEFPADQGDPYNPVGSNDSRTQAGFATFGPIHLLEVLGEVLGRALRAVWFQKWSVHRRLRPEEYGGRVHNQVLFNTTSGAQGRSYPLHTSITTSLQTGGLAGYFGNAGERFPSSYLLPQAYPEGAPTHPAYGAGHATGSGACITILKAFFDENTPIENPVQASTDGLSLVAYTGADAAQMTLGGELNKLAGNIALFRSAAGVHWRSDYTDSLPFGEEIAIGLLQELSLGVNEDRAHFALTRLDGQRIRIFDGRVVLLP